MSEPAQKPGRSKQDYGTPPEFVQALERRFGPITFDLAASKHTALASAFFTEEQDALSRSWLDLGPVAFCNPPFGDIRPWAEKCAECRWLRRWTLLLVPASMGSMWWRDHVLSKCQADGIPRLRFVGAKDLYPKDLALCAYGFGVNGHGFWDWRTGERVSYAETLQAGLATVVNG